MIGLALLLALGLACVATSAHLLHDPSSEEKLEPKSGVSGWDALIFGLCLAGILLQRKRERDESDE